MIKIIGKHVAFLVVTVWLVATISFLCAYWLPGDPARIILGPRATEMALEEFRTKAGLNQSLGQQYIDFLNRTARFDLGDSLAMRRPITEILLERSARTGVLVVAAMAWLFMFAFVLPIVLRLMQMNAARNWNDRFWNWMGIAPPYVLAVVALSVFAGWLSWVPALFESEQWSAWVLPAFVLAAYPTVVVLRLFERELDKVMGSAYILRARAMGIGTTELFLREALPNAMTAALAALANGIACFVTGTFFVEVVFGIGGVGSLTYEAIKNKDNVLLLALCLLFAVIIATMSEILEVMQALMDPKRRSGGEIRV